MDGPVGFVGVGAMGAAIAGRLLGGHELLVHDRNRAAADGLVTAGARFVESPYELAAACSIVLLSLPGPDDVTSVLLGPDGIGRRLARGSVVVDTTTSTPTVDRVVAAELAERGVDFVDAPIGGGVKRAKEGTAALMVGAAPEVFARVEKLLHEVTPHVLHLGDLGAGHTVKLVNNMLNSCNRFAALEAVRLGQAAGIAQDDLVAAINASSGRNYATEVTFPQYLSGDAGYREQGFSLALMLKDIRLATGLGRELDHAMPVSDLVEGLTERAVGRFGGDADQSRLMAEWYAR